jgi:hypothetical protein
LLQSEEVIMMGVETAAPRDTAGRWVPGRSGNPAGKRPGTRNRATLLRAALRDGEDEAAARVLIDKAVDGNLVAARDLLDASSSWRPTPTPSRRSRRSCAPW